jgi:hypothetical protein
VSSETSQPFLEDVNGANIFLDLKALILVSTIPGRFPLLSSTGLIDRIRHVESSLRSRPADSLSAWCSISLLLIISRVSFRDLRARQPAE